MLVALVIPVVVVVFDVDVVGVVVCCAGVSVSLFIMTPGFL